MDNEPSEQDSVLLARLNNLKKSTVAFDSHATVSDQVPVKIEETPEDLIARFQKLHGKAAADVTKQPSTEFSFHSEDRPPSPTIEELLAELGPEEQYTIDYTDIKEANELLAEAKRSLTVEDAASRDHEHKRSDSAEKTTASASNDEDEDAEAEASLQRVLDEVELERQQEPAPSNPSHHHNSAPSPAPSDNPDSFAALIFPPIPDYPLPSHALPSAPSNVPSSRPAKPKGSAFSEEELDSWCIICCANASIKCFGCDGDLYCWGCWREGHVGEDVGLEEKRHVWERVVRARAKKG
ncbi:hypothetical protein MMC28_009458 [Mycoblastus sanguinarius]|nr:hypothetical protein [Mycoblastus sanguinarius]